ncbi:hypothetical protein [Promicromonospora aerolata]|uniref:Uncharacterized protein n=1 Tax=Promicromonospora aerolata TaxID=195749 RepID=A0ABW4VB57_9MICO
MSIHIDLDTYHWTSVPEAYPAGEITGPEVWARLIAELAAETWEYDERTRSQLEEELLLHAERPRAGAEHRFIMMGLPNAEFLSVDVHELPHTDEIDDDVLLGLPDERMTSPAVIEPIQGRLGSGRRAVRYMAVAELGYDIVAGVNWAWRTAEQDVVVTFGTSNLVQLESVLPLIDAFAASISSGETDPEPDAASR